MLRPPSVDGEWWVVDGVLPESDVEAGALGFVRVILKVGIGSCKFAERLSSFLMAERAEEA